MDRLVATPRNPVPTGAVAGLFEAADGARLRYARWRAALDTHKGTVCVFGGRTEYIEKYFETVADLRRRGFSVATMDWRGQGGSARALRNARKGHIDDFAQFDADLDVFMREIVLPDCPPPYFALAHSMGGCILLRAATRADCWFERMVLSAPMLRLAGMRMPPEIVGGIAEAAVFLGLGNFYIPGGRDTPDEAEEAEILTSDAQRLERNRAVLRIAPELGLGSPTVAWVRAAFAAMNDIQGYDFPLSVRVPVLMLAAGVDRVVSTPAIEQLAIQLRAGAHIVIGGARHEILQERSDLRDQFWAAFDAFVPGSAPSLRTLESSQLPHADGDLRRQ